MSEGPAMKGCGRCGELNRGDDTNCWLCFAPLDGSDAPPGDRESAGERVPRTNPYEPGYAAAYTSDDSAPPGPSGQFSLVTLFLLITMSALILGLFRVAPGLGILLAIACVPPFVRTVLVVQRRSLHGSPVSHGGKVMLFLSSHGVTVIVATLALASSIGTFCGVCLSSRTELAIPIAGLIALATTFVTLVLCRKWIRHRWRRDTGLQ